MGELRVWCVLVCGVHIHHLLISHTGTSPLGSSTLYQFYCSVNNTENFAYSVDELGSKHGFFVLHLGLNVN